LPANRKDILLRKLGAKELSDLNLSELKKNMELTVLFKESTVKQPCGASKSV